MRSALTPRIYAILRELDVRGWMSAQELASAVERVSAETMLATLGRLAKPNSSREAYVKYVSPGREHTQVGTWRLTDEGKDRIREETRHA